MSRDPMAWLAEDRQRARELGDPCANLCTLANVDAEGAPQARTLVLRALDDRLAVFINATSPKFEPVAGGPVSIVVWLPSLNVQYRLSCATEPVAAEIVASSWLLRPEPPKRMDWLYTKHLPQSTVVPSRAALLDALDALDLPEPLEAPATARGLYLQPEMIERLDLSQENGIHDRRRYLPGNPSWHETVLVP